METSSKQMTARSKLPTAEKDLEMLSSQGGIPVERLERLRNQLRTSVLRRK